MTKLRKSEFNLVFCANSSNFARSNCSVKWTDGRKNRLMAGKIRHCGVVESVEASKLMVRIVQASACSACGARGLCHAAESKEKVVEVAVTDAQRFAAGQTVTIEGTSQFGLKAVRLAFLYPLVLLIAVIVLAGRLTEASEPVCALAGVAAVAAWYISLSFFKDRLRTTFAFRIVEENS